PTTYDMHTLAALSSHDPQPAENAPLSLHDALPIYKVATTENAPIRNRIPPIPPPHLRPLPASTAARTAASWAKRTSNATRQIRGDRKSTRLNSSHLGISYAVFCLKKKKKHRIRLLF